MDHLDGKPGLQIIEREDGLVLSAGGSGLYFAEYAEWYPMEQEAMRWVVPGRALDLGCGAGRVALYLQGQGLEVVGIDVSPGAIEVCRRRGVKEARRLSITQVGPALGVFDNLLMLGNNWGLMGSRGRARWFSRPLGPTARFRSALPPWRLQIGH